MGERQGAIWVEEDGPSHLLMCFWAAWGHDPWSRKASSTSRCCQATKPLAVLRDFPGYGYSLTSQYFLLCVFPDLAEDLRCICGDCPPPCSSMLACTATAVAAVAAPLQDLGQLTTSTVPTSVHQGVGSILHYRLCNPVCWEKSASPRNCSAPSTLQTTCWKRCDKPFSKLWISRTQLIYCPLS